MPQRASEPATRSDLLLILLVAVLLVGLWAARGVVILIAFATLLAYMLDPLASLLERIPFPRGRRLPRGIAAALIIITVVALIAWLAAWGIPLLAAQIAGFAERLPAQVGNIIDSLRVRAYASGHGPGLEATIDALRSYSQTLMPQLGGALMRWIPTLFARMDQLLGLAVLPVLTFYLLADQRRVRESMLRFVPEEIRPSITSSVGPFHRALQSYVRGQAVVCLTQGVATGSMLAAAGVPNALLLGVLAGLGEILPFIGAMIATIAIVLSGLTRDFGHALIGLGIYTLNNWLLGTFVTPRVMERYLKIHPFAVIVSVLAGAQLLGPPGALLALPTAAVVQAVIEDSEKRRRA